jgi:tripartite-type tricarboxylate transporter receptor subunit TctC
VTVRVAAKMVEIKSLRCKPAVRCVALLVALCGWLAPWSANAAYPERPITLVVPFAPGGSADIIARLFGAALSQTAGQPVVIDNRAGAGGRIATEAVARAKPDGYTLLLTTTAISINAVLYRSPSENPLNEFAPITELASSPSIFVVPPDSPIKSVADLVARAKAAPGKFNFATSGAGTNSHMAAELFKLRAGIDVVRVPFRGAGPAAQAILTKTTDMGSVALASAEPQVKGGLMRGLAVTGAARWPSLPEIPTLIESGFPGFVSDAFAALFAQNGTPGAIVDYLVTESRKVLQQPELRERIRQAGFEVVGGTPEELRKTVLAEMAGVRELVEKGAIKSAE